MKIKITLKTWLMVLLILNSHCIELGSKKFSSANANRKFKLQTKLKTTKISNQIKLSLKKVKGDPMSAALFAATLITIAIDSIANMVQRYADAKEAELAKLKDKGMATLVIMYEEIKLLKSGLCFNIRNSNFYFFDFLSFIIMDIYFMRQREYSKILQENHFYSDDEKGRLGNNSDFANIIHSQTIVEGSNMQDGNSTVDDEIPHEFGKNIENHQEELSINLIPPKPFIIRSIKRSGNRKLNIKVKEPPKEFPNDNNIAKQRTEKMFRIRNNIQKIPQKKLDIVDPQMSSPYYNPQVSQDNQKGQTNRKFFKLRNGKKNNQNQKIPDLMKIYGSKNKPRLIITQDDIRFPRKSKLKRKHKMDPDDQNLIDYILKPYDELSENIFEIKQQMKSFQNRICAINDDIVGEMSFIAARSRGIAKSIKETSEGSFFMVANTIIEFGTVIMDFGISNAIEARLNIQDSLDSSNRPEPNKYVYSYFLLQTKPLLREYFLDPKGFIDRALLSMKKVYRLIYVKNSKEYVDENGEIIEAGQIIPDAIKSLLDLLLILVYIVEGVILLKDQYNFDNRAAIGNGVGNSSIYAASVKSFGKMSEYFAEFIINSVKLRKLKREGTGGIVEYMKTSFLKSLAKKKLCFAITKFVLILLLAIFAKFIFRNFIKLIKYIAKKLYGSDAVVAIQKAAMIVLSVIVVLKIVLSVFKIIIAILKYFKVSSELAKFKVDFEGEQRLRDNYIQHIKIQAIYITFRHNSLIFATFKDILNFYDTISKRNLDEIQPQEQNVAQQPNQMRSEDQEDQENISEGQRPDQNSTVEEKASEAVTDQETLFIAKSKIQRIIKSRYNKLPLHQFYLKFCQENELFCYNSLSPKHLKFLHQNDGLEDEQIEVIFKYVYNDVIAGPISDAFVITPETSFLTKEYLIKNNYRFYKDKDNFGPEYALAYRRSGNACNYLLKIEPHKIVLPLNLSDTFLFENGLIKDDQDDGELNYQGNTFFTSDANHLRSVKDKDSVRYERKILILKIMTSPGIDRLRGDYNIEESSNSSKNEKEAIDIEQTHIQASDGDDQLNNLDLQQNDSQSNEQIEKEQIGRIGKQPNDLPNSKLPENEDEITGLSPTLLFALNDSHGVFDFKKMIFQHLQNDDCDYGKFNHLCYYYFSLEARLDDFKATNKLTYIPSNDEKIDKYINSCFKNESKLIIIQMFALNKENPSYIFTSNEDKLIINSVLLDKRYYSPIKDCSVNFSIVDKGMIELVEKKLNSADKNESLNSYLESEIDCFNEKMDIELKKGKTESEFKYNAQINLLKSKIEAIKLPVCTAFELFKDAYKLEKDSQCTRVGPKDFIYIYSLACESFY